MLLGYSQNTLTPSLDRPVFLAGSSPARRATAVLDELTVRALALRSPQASLVLCCLDLYGLSRPDVQEIIRRVYERAGPGSRPGILIAGTGTLSGPDALGFWSPPRTPAGAEPALLAEIRDRTVETILTALRQARQKAPALKAVTVQAPGFTRNPRHSTRLDDELVVVQILGPKDRPLASLYEFACAPQALGGDNTLFSADFPGALRRTVEAKTGAPCLFFPGAFGARLVPNVGAASPSEMERIGVGLAWAGREALEGAIRVPFREIGLERREIRVGPPGPEWRRAFRAGLLTERRDGSGSLTSEVGLVRVGPAWFAAVPGELEPRLGRAIKKELIGRGAGFAGILGQANDALGPILAGEDLQPALLPFLGGRHRQEAFSASKELGPAVETALAELLRP